MSNAVRIENHVSIQIYDDDNSFVTYVSIDNERHIILKKSKESEAVVGQWGKKQ